MAKILRKNKIKTIFIFAIIFFTALVLASIRAEAFLFWNKTEVVEIYPKNIGGDWEGVEQAEGIAEVNEDENSLYFDETNSAIYEGGTEMLVVSEFSKTMDEMTKTEDEEILEQLQGDASEEDHENKDEEGSNQDEDAAVEDAAL